MDRHRRRQHYHFAHQFLPKKIGASPAVEISRLRGGEAVSRLRTLWQRSSLTTFAWDELGSSQDLMCSPVDLAGWTGAVVHFPPPAHQCEVYFAAALVKESVLRYITLELGERSDLTVLGEWYDGNHSYHGLGPEPNEQGFITAVAKILAEGADC